MTRSTGPSTVGDLMAVDPIVMGANMPLDEAAELLDRHGISGAPVVDAAGSLVGVLSQTDLIRARSTEYLWANWPGLAVRHLMTTPAVTVERSTPIVIAAARMERHRIHRLVVVADDDRTLPIGVLSTTDVVHAIAEHVRAAATRAAGTPDSGTVSADD
jgi:CBS domain-containing protein